MMEEELIVLKDQESVKNINKIQEISEGNKNGWGTPLSNK